MPYEFEHAESADSEARLRSVLACQGSYFFATGVWPLLHMRSFEAVTGPKVDKWLVKTVGLCVATIGGALLCAAARNRVTPEIRNLGICSALSLAGVDIWYSAKGRISKVYLCDAAAELAIAGALISPAAQTAENGMIDADWRAGIGPALPDDDVEGRQSVSGVEGGVGLPR